MEPSLDDYSLKAMARPHIVALVLVLVALGISAILGTNLAWIKAFHVIFMVAWFSGLFYLPRLFVYHAMTGAHEHDALTRFCTMERKLYRFTTPFMWLTIFFGVWMLTLYGLPYLKNNLWLHVKLALVALLVCGHFAGAFFSKELREKKARSHKFYRVINELPVLVLFAIVILVIVKPF